MAELMDANRASSIRTNYQVSENYYCRDYTPQEGIRYEENNQELWRSKLEEIRIFRREKTGIQISEVQVERLITIYNKYLHIFSDAPGKVKDYQGL